MRAEILVFGALSVSDLDGLFDGDLTPTISTPGAAIAVQAAAERYKRRVRYHLKIDTGMNRLGFRFDNLRRTLPAMLASPNLELAAVYTHFATADDPESPLFEQQRARFDQARAEIAAMNDGAREERRSADRADGAAAAPAHVAAPSYTPPTARHCCAMRASGTIACAPASCSTASCRRRLRRRCR